MTCVKALLSHLQHIANHEIFDSLNEAKSPVRKKLLEVKLDVSDIKSHICLHVMDKQLP